MMLRNKTSAPRQGYVLLAVLIIIVVLALIAYRFTDAMTAESRAGVRTTDLARSRAAAISGINYMAWALTDPNTFNNTLGGNPTISSTSLSNITVWTDPNNAQRMSQFSIVAAAYLSQGIYEQRNAVIDEGGKLNINALITLDKTGVLLYNALMSLQTTGAVPLMTADIAAAIVDWVDADDNPGSASNGASVGAEDDYYQSLANPYRCKNGPLNSVDELLLVKGMTPQILYGTDQNQNGDLTDDSNASGAAPGRGLSDFVTAFSREVTVDATGQLKIYINGDDPNAIYTALKSSSIGEEMAAYIMAAKLFGTTAIPTASTTTLTGTITTTGGSGGGTVTIKIGGQGGGKGATTPKVQVGTLDDLVNAVETKLASTTSSGRAISSVLSLANTRVTLPKTSGSSSGGGKGGGKEETTTVYNSPLNDTSELNDLLPMLLDQISVKEAVEAVPRLNVNTAPQEAISAVFAAAGITDSDSDVTNIVTMRTGLDPTDVATTTGAWLVTQANLSPQKYMALERFVTGSTMIYRVQAIGYVSNSGAQPNANGNTVNGPVARIEAVIDTNLGSPRIVYFRDLSDLDNPRGFQPPSQ
jgi:type II secretory pathway component PulK